MNDTLILLLGLVLGWGLVGVGALVVVRGLFADRSRGRRRCPRCWYVMEGVPGLKCPECGRSVKREKRLLKTRRRWRRACAGLVLVVLGMSAMVVSGVIRVGWVKALPT